MAWMCWFFICWCLGYYICNVILVTGCFNYSPDVVWDEVTWIEIVVNYRFHYRSNNNVWNILLENYIRSWRSYYDWRGCRPFDKNTTFLHNVPVEILNFRFEYYLWTLLLIYDPWTENNVDLWFLISFGFSLFLVRVYDPIGLAETLFFHLLLIYSQFNLTWNTESFFLMFLDEFLQDSIQGFKINVNNVLISYCCRING